jgi:phosphoglucomutase/phosphomannomutase
VPPDDQIMADLVDQVTTIKQLAWTDALRSGRIRFLDDLPHQAYLELIRRQSLIPPPRFDEVKIVFTPLHGVGSMTAMEALINQGFRVTPVEEQMTPDGQFPNVTKTPNPEVPDSMDRAMATARRHSADLVLATDPDADRLGAMIPLEHGARSAECEAPGVARSTLHETRDYRYVTGNELAALLTHFKLQKLTEQGRLPRSPIVITTEVTTRLVTRIARHFKAQIVNNLLVGFKYIADVLWHLEQDSAFEDVRGTPEDFVIASEESHGILVTPNIRDKDAAGAALLMAELALEQKRRGYTVLDYLEALYRQFGYFRNEGVSVALGGVLGKKNMARLLDSLRATPPREIGGLAVTDFQDLRDENSHLGTIKGATDYSARNVLLVHLGERARVALRPSGTEPKAKAYIEACSAPCPAGANSADWQRTCQEVDDLSTRLAGDFLQQAMARLGMSAAEAGLG